MAQGKKGKSTTIIIIMALVVVALIVVAWIFKGGDQTKVTVENVEKRTIIATVSESGTVQPSTEVKIAPDVSGEIVELQVKEGDQVKKGDLLVTIRPDNYKSALEQAEAALNGMQAGYLQAQAALGQARANYLQDSANYVRNQQLYADSVISKLEFENLKLRRNISLSQFESSQQSVKASYFQVQSSRASLKQARQNLDRTSIFATMDGTVTLLNVEMGERVVGTIQMAGTEMLRVADLSEMEILVEINENDIINIEHGDSAHIEIDAYGDKIFVGYVSEIAYSAKLQGLGTSDQVTNFEVKVRIDPKSYQNDKEIMANPSAQVSPFRPGMSAQVEIFTQKVEDVVAVPIQSVTIRKAGDDAGNVNLKPVEIVYLLNDENIVEEAEVSTGLADDRYIAIESGLNSGERVITGPYLVLTKELEDGKEVEIKTSEDRRSRRKKTGKATEEEEAESGAEK